MGKKELKSIKDALDKQNKLVRSSPAKARQLLKQLGMLTPSGNLKRSFKPPISVSR